ncbi:Spo0B domain-containing protein [Paenibacillus tarimensis]
MIHTRTAKLAVALSVVVPAVVLFKWHSLPWSPVVFVLWVIGAAAMWVKLERKEQSHWLDRSVKAIQMTSIRTLNHHRHDWMNDLQILYGYVRMNKPDKIIHYVEKIRERMTAESRIAKLGQPALVLFLQSFRTISPSMRLDVIVEGEVNLTELPIDGKRLSETLIELINAYRFAVKPGQEDIPLLTLGISVQEGSLFVSIQVEGELTGNRELYRQLNEKLAGTPMQAVHIDPAMKEVRLRADL